MLTSFLQLTFLPLISMYPLNSLSSCFPSLQQERYVIQGLLCLLLFPLYREHCLQVSEWIGQGRDLTSFLPASEDKITMNRNIRERITMDRILLLFRPSPLPNHRQRMQQWPSFLPPSLPIQKECKNNLASLLPLSLHTENAITP